MQGAEDDILCDRATALSLDGIASEELAPLTVKGKTDPVPVFRVHGEESGVVQERAKRLPMVDRQRERSLLGHALERLDEGVGGVVIVEGEAGIGKSRLLRDVVERAEARGMRVMSGSGDAIESSTPYLAWRPILWDALDLDAAPEGQGARRRHALRWLRAHALPPDEASLLNNALELRLPESRTISALTPEAQVERTRDLVARVLAAAVGTDPTMIVIEDAHFLDSASWGLLIRVRDELSSALVVLSSRPDAEALAERAEALAGSTHLALDRLGDEDTIELVRSSLGVEELEDDVRDLVLGRAEGHPFFSQELAVSLRDAGAIVGDGGVARMAEPSGSAVAVPDTVQGVVASRIDSLEARQQMLLKVASVFGRTFDPEAVRDLLPEETARELVADDLESIEGRGLIEATNADPGSFAFAHSIVRDVSYQSMLHSQRRELHRAAAGWLEARRPERSQTLEPILAHHWLNAAGDGDDAEALSKAELHLTSAGLNALRQGAFVEAESFLLDAHSCHLRLPEDMRDQMREIEILKHLTTASFATHGFGSSEVSGISERTYALAQGRLTGREIFPILWGLWISTYHQHGGTAIELGDRLMEIAEDEGDDELLLQAHHALWTSLLQVPDYARARRHIEAGIARYRPEWHERHCFEYGGHDPGSCAERAAALIGWTTGAADRAVAHGEEAVRLAQDHAYSVANAMSALAFVHRQRRDLDALVSEAKALRERAVEFGLLAWLDWMALLEAWAGGRGGDVAGAIASMEEIAERISLKEPSYVAMLIELYAIAGRTNDGLRMVADAIARVERVGERSYEPELLRLRGVLLAQGEGREDEAERSIRSALSLADQQDALSFALRAATDLARLLSRRGHGDEPAALLRGVRARFTEGFETADLVDADELIAELESNLS
jgi:tetratricopeptide (TPR) repeat protein